MNLHDFKNCLRQFYKTRNNTVKPRKNRNTMNLHDFKNCDPDTLKLKQKYQLMRIAGGAHAQEILGERVYKRALEMIRERDTLPPGTIEIDDMYPSYKEQEDKR